MKQLSLSSLQQTAALFFLLAQKNEVVVEMAGGVLKNVAGRANVGRGTARATRSDVAPRHWPAAPALHLGEAWIGTAPAVTLEVRV